MYSKRNPGRLVNPTPDLEKVLRTQLDKLHSRDHLSFLGLEALVNLHLLFINPPNQDIMGDFYGPYNFTNIHGYPHDLPNESTMNKLPSFGGNNVVNAEEHRSSLCSSIDMLIG